MVDYTNDNRDRAQLLILQVRTEFCEKEDGAICSNLQRTVYLRALIRYDCGISNDKACGLRLWINMHVYKVWNLILGPLCKGQ